MSIKENPKLLKNLGFPHEEWEKLEPHSDSGEGSPKGDEVYIPYCTPWSLVKQKGKNLWVHPLKCKLWDCQKCAKKKLKQLRWKCLNGKPTKMLTLTARSIPGQTTDEAAQLLVTSFRKLRRLARKVFKQSKIEFIAIFERTASGMPHLHILTRMEYVPQRWISLQMMNFMNSPIVDIRQIKNKRMASMYVTKYVTKAPERFKGTKRFWTSFDYVKKPKNPHQEVSANSDKFYVIRSMAHKALTGLVKMGYATYETMKPYTLSWSKNKPPPRMPGHLDQCWA